MERTNGSDNTFQYFTKAIIHMASPSLDKTTKNITPTTKIKNKGLKSSQ
jgi:hypothetical protein